MTISIVTFADRRFWRAHQRFRAQAAEMGVFDQVFVYTEKDLDPAFRNKFAGLLRSDVRGFGYWVWKPQVIVQALRNIQIGDHLIYLDTGSHLNPHGINRLKDYVSEASRSATGILGFQLHFPEKSFTKADLLDHFSFLDNAEVLDSGQIQAGAIVIQKRASSLTFFSEWLSFYSENIELVDDSPSKIPNDDSFVEHRHDQAVFSLLAKRHGVSLRTAREQFPYAADVQWVDLHEEPFHHRRDIQSSRAQLEQSLRLFRERMIDPLYRWSRNTWSRRRPKPSAPSGEAESK